jgi:hypothetical protein
MVNWKPQESATMAGAALIAAAIVTPQRTVHKGLPPEADPDEVKAIADIFMVWLDEKML